MIDLHAHPLPGLDDGPADGAGAQDLLRLAAADGIEVMVATPHLGPDFPAVTPAAIRDAVEEVRRVSAGASGVVVLPGAQVSAEWADQASDDDLGLATYGQLGKDLLFDAPAGPLPPRFEEILFGLGLRGFRLTVAHPEVSPELRAEPRRVLDLVRHGILVQVNAGSLVAGAASAAGRFAVALVAEGNAHFIASDAHSAAESPPRMREARAVAERLVGARADWMTLEAPAAVLAGASLPRPPGRTATQRRR